MPSFTVSASAKMRALVSPCQIAAAFDPASPVDKHLPLRNFQAIWDTGATDSVISQRMVDECSLKPVGMAQVFNVNAAHNCEVYLINIMLPNRVGFVARRVTKQGLRGADALIGMDIIGVVILWPQTKTVKQFSLSGSLQPGASTL